MTDTAIRCEWFALCTNEATLLLPHPAFAQGVPACQRCANKAELKGQPLPHWETWFKLLWNAALAAMDDFDTAGTFPADHPMFGLLETMHGIAEDQPSMTNDGTLKELLG